MLLCIHLIHVCWGGLVWNVVYIPQRSTECIWIEVDTDIQTKL